MTFTNILFHGFLSSQSSDFHNFASIFIAFMEVLPHSSIQEILPLMLFGEWARRPCRWRKFLISWILEMSLMAQWVKNPHARQEAQKTQSDPWFRKISWRKKWQSTPVLLPEKKSQGWRSLVGYSPWGHKDSDSPEQQLCPEEEWGGFGLGSSSHKGENWKDWGVFFLLHFVLLIFSLIQSKMQEKTIRFSCFYFACITNS